MVKEHREILYSKGNNDECYTPDYAVEPILEYISSASRHKSLFSKSFKNLGLNFSNPSLVKYFSPLSFNNSNAVAILSP